MSVEQYLSQEIMIWLLKIIHSPIHVGAISFLPNYTPKPYRLISVYIFIDKGLAN